MGLRRFGIHHPLAFSATDLFHIPAVEALFDNFALHSIPLATSVADSFLLSQKVGRTITITVTNHPLPPTNADKLKNKGIVGTASLVINYAVIVAMSMTVSAYASFLIRERKKQSKHMQVHLCLLAIKPFLWHCFRCCTAFGRGFTG